MRRFLSILLAIMIMLACNETSSSVDSTEAAVSPSSTENISLLRAEVSKLPVAEHQERTDNPLNDWYFSVQLFETSNTFYYLMKLQFEEIRGEDTLKLPNFGTMPKPVIRKGSEKYSCIVGFMDNENKFREYKKVHVKNNSLKVTALKHYAVSRQ